MSIPFSGSLSRSAGVVAAIAKQKKLLNLKAVERITVQFDPFHEQSKHTREFLHFISAPKLAEVYPNYKLKTEILCNRQDPTVTVKISPEIADASGTKTVTLKSKNLTCLEIFEILNKHITPLAPPEEATEVVETKSLKKSRKR